MQEFKVKLKDYGKLRRRYLILVLITFILFFTFIPFLFWLHKFTAGEMIMLLFLTFVYLVIAVLITHNSVKKDSPVSMSNDMIFGIKYGEIAIKEITYVDMPLNYNGHHSLMILSLESGKKYSVNVLNKYNGMANDEFDLFIKAFKIVLKRNNLEIKG